MKPTFEQQQELDALHQYMRDRRMSVSRSARYWGLTIDTMRKILTGKKPIPEHIKKEI